MSDAERVKGLLDGSMDPAELEDDSELYALAERIYGRESLDEMGIAAPVRPVEVDPEFHTNEDDLEVELPDIPEVDEIAIRPRKGPSGRRIMLMAGLIGLVLVSFNVTIGIGQYLNLCEDERTAPLSFSTTSNWQNESFHITWTASNLNTSVNYSIHWFMSQNGSVELVDSDWFNWTGSSNLIHSENRVVSSPPWCYISTLYSEGIEIAQSNDCFGNSSTTSVLAEISEANMLCEDNTRLLWDKSVNYQSIDSWAPSGTGGLLDGALLMLFGMITLRSALRKK
jgi:hypothetical protein